MKVIHVCYEKQMRACVSCIHGRIRTHILRVSNSLSVPYKSVLSLFGDKRSWAGNTGLLHKSPALTLQWMLGRGFPCLPNCNCFSTTPPSSLPPSFSSAELYEPGLHDGCSIIAFYSSALSEYLMHSLSHLRGYHTDFVL